MNLEHPIAEAGWAECPRCEDSFLSVAGARCRCPHCGHVFCVERVTLARPGRFDESKPSGKQWLLRIEIGLARLFAEALADRQPFLLQMALEAKRAGWGEAEWEFYNRPLADRLEQSPDARDFLGAWRQVRALRFGQTIEFRS